MAYLSSDLVRVHGMTLASFALLKRFIVENGHGLVRLYHLLTAVPTARMESVNCRLGLLPRATGRSN